MSDRNALVLPAGFAALKAWSSSTHFVVTAPDDSMEARGIRAGDIVVIDGSKRDVQSHGLYALQMPAGVEVRVVAPLPGGRLRVSAASHRAEFPSFEIPAADLIIIGKAVHRHGAL